MLTCLKGKECRMKKLWILTSFIALSLGCFQSRSWVKEIDQLSVKDYLTGVGKARYTITSSEVELTASQKARDNLEEQINLWLQRAKKIWLEKTTLYQPFDDPDFTKNFIFEQRVGASILIYHDDKARQILYCVVGIPVEKFLGQLRSQAAYFVAKNHKISKEDEVKWNSLIKEVMAELVKIHNKRAKWEWLPGEKNFVPWQEGGEKEEGEGVEE